MAEDSVWSARYDLGTTPWDLGRPHPALSDRLRADPGLGGAPGSVLVPGAGRGHDAAAFAAAGWSVLAVDFAPAVEADLVARLGAGSVAIDDALEMETRCDLVFDHTFFCALDPDDRPRFGEMAERVLGPAGRVISIVFPIGGTEPGPPWPVTVESMSAALGSGFELVEAAAPRRTPGRNRPHRWAEWRRR